MTEQIGWQEEGPVNLREERNRLRHSKRWLTRYEELATSSADHLIVSDWEQRQRASQS